MDEPRKHANGYAFRLDEHGAITSDKAEGLALILADDIDRNEAWRALGGLTSGRDSKVRTSRSYRDRIMQTPVFIQRLESLVAEKEKLMADEPWGEALWAARQLWREARRVNDLQVMKDAAKAILSITSQRAAASGTSTPVGEDAGTQPRAPGRPAAENPQTKRAPSAIAAELLKMGSKHKAPETIN